jgi:tetratricopeptide (TPR) repeat protein
MPRVVKQIHPGEVDLLNVATGKADAAAAAEVRRHLEGCELCAKRFEDLTELVGAITEDEALETMPDLDDFQPDRPVPFVKARPPLEEIYRVSRRAEIPAERILLAARVSMEEVEKAVRAVDGCPCRAFALLYASQKASSLVASDPGRALELSKKMFEEARSLMDANLERRTATPAPRQNIQAEALLLESQAQLQLGFADEARAAAVRARTLFRESGDIGFGKALCDYYEGSAAGFAKDYAGGERLLKRALRIFAEFGQDHLVGRTEAALGTLFLHRGDNARALQCFDHALPLLDTRGEAMRATMTLNNRATALSRLERFDEARASYARALNLARKHGYRSHLHIVRNGLADLDFRRGRFLRALRAFGELAREASASGYERERLFARLYVAESLGRLGRHEEMIVEIASIREEQRETRFGPSPATDELFACIDQAMVDADLIGHVRRFLQEVESGVPRPYKRLRLVG